MSFNSKFEAELGKQWNVRPSDFNSDNPDHKEVAEAFQGFLEEIYLRVGEPDSRRWKVLGEGSNGVVFWMNNHARVLKLTRDIQDAYASEIVKKKPDKNLIKVYDVFEMGLPYFGEKWCIVNEKLTPLSSSEEKEWQNIILVARGRYSKYGLPTMHELSLNWVLEVQEWLDSERIWDAPYHILEAIRAHMPTLKTWAKLLEDRGIEWGDLSLGNIMKRGHLTVISDLGFGRTSSSPSIPQLEV